MEDNRTMIPGKNAATHAGTLYRRAFSFLRHPVRKVEDEAEHLHDVERAGVSAETPLIAILGLILFLVPIFLLIVGLSFAAYYLAS
jgi:hypothetical protein